MRVFIYAQRIFNRIELLIKKNIIFVLKEYYFNKVNMSQIRKVLQGTDFEHLIDKFELSGHSNLDAFMRIVANGELLNYVDCSTLVTQTGTPASTPTQTPSQSPSGAAGQFVSVNNGSLDISITDVTINGVSVTYYSSSNFPLISGENGSFTTTQLGTYDIVVSYGIGTPGQNITVEDSSNVITCFGVGSSGSVTVYGATIDAINPITITAADGACP